MPKVIAELPLTEDEAAVLLVSLVLREAHFPPASRNDMSHLKSLIKQLRQITNTVEADERGADYEVEDTFNLSIYRRTLNRGSSCS